jgi:DHA2 family multidrug resistance protein
MSPSPAGPPLNRRMITLSVMLATIIQALDTTIANVALPHMQGSLSASQDQISWVLTSYIVAAAIGTPLTGWLCARYTQKRVFLVAVAGFTIASLWCGIATSLTEIVLARLLQGLFGAALVPLSQSVMLETTPPEQRGRAMAVWGMGVMVGPILGPTVGGWLTENYDWRWVFLINLPIGALAFYGIARFIPGAVAQRSQRFDVFGFATLSIAIGALQLLLDRGQENDWFGSLETWVELLAGLLAVACFIVHTACLPAGETFLDYRLFRNRNFTTGLLLIFIVGMVLYATRALTPPMLESLMGYPVSAIGLLTAPSGIGTMLAMLVVGRLVGRVDLRFLLVGGFAVTAISLWQMSSYTLTISASDILWPGVVQGAGLGLVFVALTTATFATLEPAMFPQGTSLFSLVRNVGSSIGISAVQSLLVHNTAVAHASLVANVHMNDYLGQGAGALDISGAPSAVAIDVLNAEITRQAAMIAYLDDFKLMLGLTLLVIPVLLLIQPATAPVPAAGEATID